MQKILISMCVVFLLGGIVGFVVGGAIYNYSGGTGSDQSALEESRRVIAGQREALEILGNRTIESQRIIDNLRTELAEYLERERKAQESIQRTIENNSGAIELSEDARSEIQSAIDILEGVESRK